MYVYLLFQGIVRCLWHPKTNQLAVGLGDGNVKIFYDPEKSHRSVVVERRKTRYRENAIAIESEAKDPLNL